MGHKRAVRQPEERASEGRGGGSRTEGGVSPIFFSLPAFFSEPAANQRALGAV